MKLVDVIIVLVIAAVIGLAVWYVYKAKKSGKKCIGCPDGCSCSSKANGGDCSCGCQQGN
jgi:hypothetical protein